jgi:hypothetical protein
MYQMSIEEVGIILHLCFKLHDSIYAYFGSLNSVSFNQMENPEKSLFEHKSLNL